MRGCGGEGREMGVCNQWGSPARSGMNDDTVIWVELGGGVGVGVRALYEAIGNNNNRCNNTGCV